MLSAGFDFFIFPRGPRRGDFIGVVGERKLGAFPLCAEGRGRRAKPEQGLLDFRRARATSAGIGIFVAQNLGTFGTFRRSCASLEVGLAS